MCDEVEAEVKFNVNCCVFGRERRTLEDRSRSRSSTARSRSASFMCSTNTFATIAVRAVG